MGGSVPEAAGAQRQPLASADLPPIKAWQDSAESGQSGTNTDQCYCALTHTSVLFADLHAHTHPVLLRARLHLLPLHCCPASKTCSSAKSQNLQLWAYEAPRLPCDHRHVSRWWRTLSGCSGCVVLTALLFLPIRRIQVMALKAAGVQATNAPARHASDTALSQVTSHVL